MKSTCSPNGNSDGAQSLLADRAPAWKWAGAVALGMVFHFSLGILSSEAACTACATFRSGTVWGTASPNPLIEASGLAASRRNTGVLWTHNDGAGGRIYALGTNGAQLANFDLNENVADVEDIAVGPGPVAGVSYLYIGDIGGSVGAETVRADVQILRVAEPPVNLAWAGDAKSRDFDGVEKFTLVYPDGSHDAESLLIDPQSGDLFVVTKQDGSARVYRASLAGLANGAVVTLAFVRLVLLGQVSGGDISVDGSQIVLRREDAAVLWARCDNESIGTALSRSGQTIPIVGPPEELNGEGFAFLSDGTGYATISEGADPSIYFFQSLCPAAPRFTLPLADGSVLAGGSATFYAVAVGYPPPTYQWRFQGQVISGQTGSSLTLFNVTAAQAGTYEVTASNGSGTAASAATLMVRPKPDLRITEVQSSTAPSTGVPSADWWELTSFEAQPVNLAGWRFNDNGGGLTDPFVFGAGLAIQPGESIVFAENLTPAEFRNWWGSVNVPAAVQIIIYDTGGLSFGASGDGVRLWNETTTSPTDPVASVDFGAAENGVTFNYDPATGQFGGKSQVGVNGVIRAALSSNDIGSPGRIFAPASRPSLRISSVTDKVRIAFDTAIGRRYSLEVRSDLAAGTWTPTGDTFEAPDNGVIYFEKTVSAGQRFYRVLVE